MNREEVSPAVLAHALGIHAGSVSRMYGNASMQTKQLQIISETLEHDFFAVYSSILNFKKPETIIQNPTVLVEKSECEKQLEQKNLEIEALKKEIETLKMDEIKKENAFLRQINELLKKK